jgi:flagellar assembly protein FliH
MAKNVFRYNEYIAKADKIITIKAPSPPKKSAQESVVEEYAGPTADDLRREAEEFKKNWEAEKAMMIQEAEVKAQEIIKEAEDTAFQKVKKETENARRLKDEALKEKDEIIEEGKAEAERIKGEVQKNLDAVQEEHKKKGYDEGFEAGWEESKGEMDRLVERIHIIIDRIIEKRGEIIEGTETQVVNLVLLIAKKVIKVISENQKNVVINNVLQALRKIKTRGDVIIRVNLDDLQLTTDHTKEFLQLVENVRSISVLEDSSVDKGGAMIETDFGQIDARIASQLHEIEEKILELMPIKNKTPGLDDNLIE